LFCICPLPDPGNKQSIDRAITIRPFEMDNKGVT